VVAPQLHEADLSAEQMLAKLTEAERAEYALSVAENYDKIEQIYTAALGVSQSVELAASTNKRA
jgi:hypothetical protein